MSNNWYESGSWYDPLEKNIPKADVKVGNTKKGLTPGRIIALCAVILVLVVASSMAFGGKNTASSTGNSSNGVLPSDFKEFFENYYTSTSTESAEVNIPHYDSKINFRLEMNTATGKELTLQELYKNSVDTIVSIKAYADNNPAGYIWGSGVILSADGIILTNTHVVENQDRVVVTVMDKDEYEASLIGADSISDIAVLKIDAHNLPCAEFGDSNALTIGDRVAAIGNPLSANFRLTLTDGIISGIERGMQYNGHIMNLLQTNTAINNGNSGGALFNMYGQVIGITNMKMMSNYSSIEGIGFAIPSANAINMVNAILESGKVTGRTSIGITVGPIPSEIGKHYELPEGLYVSDVNEKSDAYTKGIQIGDIIIAANDEPVKVNSDLTLIKDRYAVGDSLKLTVWRNGETIDIEIVLVDTLDLY